MDKILEAQGLTIDEQLNALKSEKKKMGGIFDIQINQLELQKNENKTKRNELASAEKEVKLKEELVRSVLESQAPQMPGQIDQMVPVEPEAQGLALLNMER